MIYWTSYFFHSEETEFCWGTLQLFFHLTNPSVCLSPELLRRKEGGSFCKVPQDLMQLPDNRKHLKDLLPTAGAISPGDSAIHFFCDPLACAKAVICRAAL